jgi:pseudooxynicotine oxidase
VNRRDALKGLGAAAVAGTSAVSRAPTRSKPSRPQLWDAVVIGGGFAGVTAARDLGQRGLATLLIEARDRLGGRTDNVMFAGHKIEVGGTWIGWGQPHVWAEKMRYGLAVAESAAAKADAQYIWIDNDRPVLGTADQYWSLMGPAYDAFYAPARQALPEPYDPLLVKTNDRYDRISAGQAIDALNVTRLQRELLHSFAAINGHSSSYKSSYLDQLRWIALGGFSTGFMWDNLGRYRLADGTEMLIARMLADARAEIELNSVVSRISQSASGVEVITKSGKVHRARAAVVALPLNVLAKVAFTPSLSPAKHNASVRRHTGSGTKIWAKVPGRRPSFFANGPEQLPLNFLWTEFNDGNSQLLVGFGASRERLDINNRAQVQKAVRNFLPDAEVTEIHGHDWTADPYSLGTWCMYPPGLLTSSLPALQRPEGNLYFATSDIASGWRGFIDGAVESGAVAAQHVASALRSRAHEDEVFSS